MTTIPAMTRAAKRRALMIGLGSLLDLRGIATYRAMQDLMPSPALKPMSQIYRETNQLMASTPTSLSKLRSSSPK